MTTKKRNTKGKNTALKRIRRVFPYFAALLLIVAVASFGSKDKFEEHNSNIDMRALAQNNFSASTSQTAELYIVSELASSMQVSTASVITTNYDSLSSASALAANISSDKIEKPSVVNVGHLAVGVIEYTAQAGDTIAKIANKYTSTGVTETMIRWSNNFKASYEPNAGDKIFVPSRAGFVHVVKNGETLHSIASTYHSSVEELIAANSLELSETVEVGARILIPNGELPETERPDYVAPVVKRTYNTPASSVYAFGYAAQYAKGNKYAYGWCTWYAWNQRPDLPSNMGNARNWGSAARSAGFPVDGSPRAGDVFSSTAGYYGHVGYVTGVSGDTVSICDMNGTAGWGRVGCRSVSRSEWGGWSFIHRR